MDVDRRCGDDRRLWRRARDQAPPAAQPAGNRIHRAAVSHAFYPDKEQNGPAQILAFANDLGLTFDILHDPSGAIRQSYDIFGVPESYLIDRDGMIVKRVIGAANWEDPVNEVLIRRLLSEP